MQTKIKNEASIRFHNTTNRHRIAIGNLSTSLESTSPLYTNTFGIVSNIDTVQIRMTRPIKPAREYRFLLPVTKLELESMVSISSR